MRLSVSILEGVGAASVSFGGGEGDPHAVIAEVVSVSESLSTPNVPMMASRAGPVSVGGEYSTVRATLRGAALMLKSAGRVLAEEIQRLLLHL